MKPFNLQLNELIRASGKSLNEVAKYGHVDRTYLNRLLSGEKTNPSPEVVIRLWIGIVMDTNFYASDPQHHWGLERLIMSSIWTSASGALVSDVGGVRSTTQAD